MSNGRAQDEASSTKLIHVLAHDLRGPARALRQYLVLLKQDMGHELSETSSRYTKRMQDILDRMDERLDALLSLADCDRPSGTIAQQNLSTMVANAATAASNAGPATRELAGARHGSLCSRFLASKNVAA